MELITTLEGIKTAGELAAKAFELCKFIKERFESVKANRTQFQRLLQRLEFLESSLRSFKPDERPESFGRQVTGFYQSFVEKMSRYKYVEMLFHGGSIAEQLTDFSCELRERCADLQFTTVMDLKNWSEQDQKDVSLDNAELKTILDQFEKGQEKVLDILNINHNQLLSNLHVLQSKIENNIYMGGYEKMIAEAIARALHCYSKQKKLSTISGTESSNSYDWVISRDTVTIGPKIGSGGFSNVYLSKYLNSDVAAKVFEIGDVGELDLILNEAKIWQALRHDHIVPLIGVCLNNGTQPFIISQYCKNGTVKSFLKSHDYEPSLCIKFIYQIASGMAYLHSRNIIHNDLKAINVLVDKAGDAKIIDFGMSASKRICTINNKTTYKAVMDGGTQRWMAPEKLLDEANVTKASDVYSYGMTCYEIVSSGKIPFERVNDALLYQRIVYDKKRLDKPKLELTSFANLDFLWSLVMECSQYNPENRPRFSVILVKLEPHLMSDSKEPNFDSVSLVPSSETTEKTFMVSKKKDDYMVHRHISKHDFRSFWIENFGQDAVQIEWHVFYKALCKQYPMAQNGEPSLRGYFDKNFDGHVTLVEMKEASNASDSLQEIIDSICIPVNDLDFLGAKIVNQKARKFWSEYFGSRTESCEWHYFLDCIKCEIQVKDPVMLKEKLFVKADGIVTIENWNSLTVNLETLHEITLEGKEDFKKKSIFSNMMKNIFPQTKPETASARLFTVAELLREARKFKDAARFYKKAIEKNENNQKAHFMMGKFYEEGLGLEQNFNLAIYHYSKANNSGSKDFMDKAMAKVDYCKTVNDMFLKAVEYHKIKSYNLALPLLEKASFENHGAALNLLGVMNLYGEIPGRQRDETEAVKLFEKSSTLNCSEGHFNLAMSYLKQKKNLHVAVKLLKKASDNGNTASQVNLGLLYETGTEVSLNYNEAFRYYSMAAERGNNHAQNFLGQLYITGKGTKVNIKEGFRLFELSAAKGNDMAYFNLGLMYEHGNGVVMNKQKAVEYYKISAKSGNAKAQNNLAAMYQFGGNGVERNLVEAVNLYKQSAIQGNVFAQTNLALLLIKGASPEIYPDPHEAIRLLESASALGHLEAIRILQEMRSSPLPRQI